MLQVVVSRGTAPMKRRRSLRISLTLMTAALVLLVAALAGTSLWVLRRLHRQLAHEAAAQSVLAEGRRIAVQLGAEPAVTGVGPGAGNWEAFSRQVRLMHTVQNGLQYVSVMRDGATVFLEQTTALDGSSPAPSSGLATNLDVRMTRRLLKVGREDVPVVVFGTEIPGADGKPSVLEVALRKDTVEREEQAAATAIASMFRVSLATVIVSFAACLVLVAWMMRREVAREKQRREEEHLAFAGVMANGIVHDFRNPMSSLRLDVQMMQKEAARGGDCRLDRIGDLAGRVRSTLDRMDKVFQEFFYWAHASASASICWRRAWSRRACR
jgi:signal transduction histidine kinase